MSNLSQTIDIARAIDGRGMGRRIGRKIGRTGALLASASLVALLCRVPDAAAAECAGPVGAPPANIATPAMLYEQLRARTNAELLAIGFTRKEVAEDCAWIYEVKMLTASGSVVELDFAATDLGLLGARGPQNDRDAVALVRGLGAEDTVLINGSDRSGRSTSPTKTGGGGEQTDGGDDGHDDGGGEGGNSGSGSDGGGSGGSGSGDGGSGDGGSGGGSGEGGSDGGGDGGSGEGGDGGGDSGEGGDD